MTTTEQKPVTMILACNINSQDTPEATGFNYIKEHLEAQSKGRISVEIYMASVLGADLEALEQARSGILTLTVSAWGVMDRYCKDLYPFVVPYLYSDREAGRRTLQGPIGDAIQKRLNENDLEMGGALCRGFRLLTSNKPIKTVNDVRGLKLRLPDTSAWLAVWSELGAIPSPIPVNEVFSALQTGVVDAQENPIASIYDKKMWEVQKYINMTNHILDFTYFIMSKRWLDNLDEDSRKMVKGIVTDSLVEAEKYVDTMADNLLQDMINRGMTAVDTDLESFRQKSRPTINQIQTEWQSWVYEQVLKDIEG
jgi:tripartite ATP-independent transporter DctP family solute receptor